MIHIELPDGSATFCRSPDRGPPNMTWATFLAMVQEARRKTLPIGGLFCAMCLDLGLRTVPPMDMKVGH